MAAPIVSAFTSAFSKVAAKAVYVPFADVESVLRNSGKDSLASVLAYSILVVKADGTLASDNLEDAAYATMPNVMYRKATQSQTNFGETRRTLANGAFKNEPKFGGDMDATERRKIAARHAATMVGAFGRPDGSDGKAGTRKATPRGTGKVVAKAVKPALTEGASGYAATPDHTQGA